MHFHFVGIDELPEPIRQAMLGQDDKDMRQARHELLRREEAIFWNSLDKDQMHWVMRMLQMIEDSDEPGQTAARHLGQADAYMAQRFKSCLCGEVHRDTDDLMRHLAEASRNVSAEERELKRLNLARIEGGMFVNPEHVGKFHCTKCNIIFETVEERKEAAIGSSHSGCVV
jgi:hypothetical protein